MVMKEPLILEAVPAESTAVPHRLGIAFNHANTVKVVPVEAQPETEQNRGGGVRAVLGNFFKPALSNLFLLGCLLGLFVLYCCSCVVHALTFPARRKSS
jgi:hypothetical protein